MSEDKLNPLDIGIILIQIAKVYQLFAEATKDLTAEEQAELWAKTTLRAKLAREIWERAL